MEELRRKERGGRGLEGMGVGGERKKNKTTHTCVHRASTLRVLWKHKGASLPDFIKVN